MLEGLLAKKDRMKFGKKRMVDFRGKVRSSKANGLQQCGEVALGYFACFM